MSNLNRLSSIFRTATKSQPKPKPETFTSSTTRNHQESASSAVSNLIDKHLNSNTSKKLSRADSILPILSSTATSSAYKSDEARHLSKDILSLLQDGSFDIASALEETDDGGNALGDGLNVPWLSDFSHKAMTRQRKETSRLRKEKWISITTSCNRFGRLVNLCGQNLGTGAAVDIFMRLGRQTGLKDYNALIKVCLENARKSDDEDVVVEQISIVFKLLKLMKEKGFPLNEETYGPPLLYFIDKGMVEEFHFFSDVIKDKNNASLARLSYYEMLLYIRVNNEEKVRELCHYISTNDSDETAKRRENYFAALCDSDRKCDLLQLLDVFDITKFSSAKNIASVFESLGRLSLESYAERFLLAFKEFDYGADKISNLIFKYATSAPYLVVEDVVSKFKNLHSLLEMEPHLKSYEEMLVYCCKLHEVHVALDVVHQTCEEGLTLSADTLNLLLRAIEDCFEFHLVHRIYSLIHDKDLKPTADTFRMLISLCVRMKEFDSAYAMLNDLKKFNLEPTASMYNTIMAGYFREKNPSAARKVVNQMELAGVKPDSQTYFYLLSNCKCEKKISEYNEEMQHAEIEMTKHMFMALINAYASCGQFEKAKEVIWDIRVPVSNVNEIKSVLVSALASHGQPCDALSIYEEMKEAKWHVMPKAIVSLIECCQSEVDLNGLLKLLEEVQDSEYWASCCSRVISYCLHNKHLSSAIDLLKQLKDKFQDNELAMEVLFDETFATFAEMESPDLQFGMNLLQAIENELGASPSRKCLDFLLTACITAKDLYHSHLIWKKYRYLDLPYNIMSFLGMYQALLACGDHVSAKTILSKIPTGDHDIRTIIQACQRKYPAPSTPEKQEEMKKKKKKKAVGSK